MGDAWGDDEWAPPVRPPSTLWARVTAVFALSGIGFIAILGAGYEYKKWQDSKISSGILQDYSPGTYLLAMLVFGTFGLLALSASWLIWSRRYRGQAPGVLLVGLGVILFLLTLVLAFTIYGEICGVLGVAFLVAGIVRIVENGVQRRSMRRSMPNMNADGSGH